MKTMKKMLMICINTFCLHRTSQMNRHCFPHIPVSQLTFPTSCTAKISIEAFYYAYSRLNPMNVAHPRSLFKIRVVNLKSLCFTYSHVPCISFPELCLSVSAYRFLLARLTLRPEDERSTFIRNVWTSTNSRT
jgi:hypothetical protein